MGHVVTNVYHDADEVVELREVVVERDGKGKAVQGGVVAVGGDTDGRLQNGGRESVITVLLSFDLFCFEMQRSRRRDGRVFSLGTC